MPVSLLRSKYEQGEDISVKSSPPVEGSSEKRSETLHKGSGVSKMH